MTNELMELLERIDASSERGALRELAQQLALELRGDGDETLESFQIAVFDALVQASPYGQAYLEALGDLAEAEVWRRSVSARAALREATLHKPEVQRVLHALSGGRCLDHKQLLAQTRQHVKNATALSRLLRELAELGFVEVVPDTDGRRKPRALTAAGQAAVARLGPEAALTFQQVVPASPPRRGHHFQSTQARIQSLWNDEQTQANTPFLQRQRA